MLTLKRDIFGKGRPLSFAIIGGSLSLSTALWAQAPGPDSKVELKEESSPEAPNQDTAKPEPTNKPEAAPVEAPRPEAPPEPPKKPEPPPSPFTFTLKGFVSGTFYAQDASFASGNGNGAIFGPNKLATDKWFLGGDVRQTQLKFMVKGPEVLGGIPTAVVEVDFLGGNQVNTVPGATSVVTVKDAMGNTVGT